MFRIELGIGGIRNGLVLSTLVSCEIRVQVRVDETGDSLVLPLPLFQAGSGITRCEARILHRIHHSNNACRRSIPEDPVLRIPTKDFGCLNCLQCDQNQSESEPNRSNPPVSCPLVPTEKKRVAENLCDASESVTCVTVIALCLQQPRAPTEPKQHDSGQPTHLSSCGWLRWQFLLWCSESFHHRWPVLGGPWELQLERMYVTLG